MNNLKEALAQDDSMSTINERNHRKNPPYKCCDKEVDYSDDDFMEIYD